MWKKTFQFFLIVFLLAGIFSEAFAQRQTGSIQGRVVDTEGKPLPGAFVYVYSPDLMGIRTYMATDKGKFRIPGLPPGLYKVMAEAPEFKTVSAENIAVRVGMTITLRITLERSAAEEEVTVEINPPTADAQSSKTSVNTEKELLNDIPFSKNFQDVINSAAGTASGGFLENSVAHGSTVRASTYSLDGLALNDPVGRILHSAVNFDLIEEVEVDASGHPAEVGLTGGAYINVVTKSGGNRHSGSADAYYSDHTLASRLRPKDELSAPGVSRPPVDNYLWDISFSLGGPILEDTLWYFTNFRTIFQSQTTPLIPWEDPLGSNHLPFNQRSSEKTEFFKLSSQFVPQLKVTASVNAAQRYQSAYEPTLSWNLPQQATLILDNEKSLMATGSLSYTIDPNTYLDLKGGYSQQKIPLKLNDKGQSNPQYIDQGTGFVWGSSRFNEILERKRFQAQAAITRFQDRLMAADHELKAGAEYEYDFGEDAVWKEDNLIVDYYYGSPYYFGLEQSPSTGTTVGKGKISFSIAGKQQVELNPKSELRRLGFFAQDAMTFADRLTLSLGLRFDRSTARLYDMVKDESGNPLSVELGVNVIEPLCGVNPYELSALTEWKDVMVWNALSPRFGLSFDIFGNGKTFFKASFSRYTEHMILDYLSDLNPLQSRRAHQFIWFDENMDGSVGLGDTFSIFPEDYRLYSGEYVKKRLASGTKPPYTDEFTAGFHQELFRDFSFRVSYIYKTHKNILESVRYDPDSDKDWYTTELDTENWWIPFQTIVPGVDGYPDTPVTAYFLSNSAPTEFYRIKNVPELKREYQALEFAFKKRMSNNWQLNGSLVLSRAEGNIGLGYGASSGFSKAADDPNSFINLNTRSRLDFDRPLVIKMMGSYRFPSNLLLSFYYQYLSGTPWARRVTIIPPSAWAQAENVYRGEAAVYLESPGSRRTSAFERLDLRVEKELKLKGAKRLSFFVDIINALGEKTSFDFPNDDGFWFPDDENTNQGIRRLNSSYKNMTLLSGTRVFKLSLGYSF